MRKFLDENFKLVLYGPPILIALIISIIEGQAYLLITVLPITIGWSLLTMLIMFIDGSITPKIDKETANKVQSKLNISNKEWKKFSRQQKKELNFYSQKQDELIKREIRVKTAFSKNKESIKSEIEDEWKNLNWKERIKRIDNDEIKRHKAYEKRKEDQAKKILRDNELAEKKEKERILKEKQDLLRKQEEDKRIAEEKVKRDEIEREERKKLEEIKKQELLVERKKQRDKEYKERIKRQLLEKERKKLLESEAVQELIDNGELSENFSLQNQRTPIPSYIKEAVWKRDKQRCVNCGSRENLEFDHNIPVSKGGSNSINNIQLLCQKCNRTKSNKIM
jgi:hypothetical protein